jgi:hypothetical protein
MNGIPERRPSLTHRVWRKFGMWRGWYTQHWNGPSRGIHRVFFAGERVRKGVIVIWVDGQEYQFRWGDTLTVAIPELTHEAVDNALTAWFEAALKGAAEPIRDALIESHHGRMRAALAAAGLHPPKGES